MGKIISVRHRFLADRRDFRSIFAEHLPGNFAKLQPPDEQDLMQGLEVKVKLGSVWKQYDRIERRSTVSCTSIPFKKKLNRV